MDDKQDIFAELTVAPACADQSIPDLPPIPPIPPTPPIPPIPPTPPIPQEVGQGDLERKLEHADAYLRRMTARHYQTPEEQFCLDAEALADCPVVPCEPVHFPGIFPTLSSATEPQRAYYIYWKDQLLQRNFLPADEAYTLLFLYETINLTRRISAEQAFDRLHLLLDFVHQQQAEGADRILMACRDLILYDNLDRDYLQTAASWDAKAASKVFFTEVIADPDQAKACGLSFVTAAASGCKSRIQESPYYEKHPERTERALYHLLVACNARYETECGGFAERFVGRRALFYSPFSRFLFAKNRPCSLNGPYPYSRRRQFAGQNGQLFANLQGLGMNPLFERTMADLLKAMECLLRQDDHFPYRLKFPERLPKGLQQAVHSAFDTLLSEEQEEKRRQFHLNSRALHKIRQDTDRIRARLIEELEGNPAVDACQAAEEPRPSAPKHEAHTIEKDPEEDCLLTGAERQVLTLLLAGKPAQEEAKQAAREQNMLPMAWFSRLNEKLFSLENDTVLEEENGVWSIFEEYRADVEQLLARAKEEF